MSIHVTESDPRSLDAQFIEAYPALLLKETANSGAFWGDGDMRPTDKSLDDRESFAVESKARFRGRLSKSLRPTSPEWRKAMSQLKKFDNTATRLFLVYASKLKTFGVTIPKRDLKRLVGTDLMKELEKEEVQVDNEDAYFFTEAQWDVLYKQIEIINDGYIHEEESR